MATSARGLALSFVELRVSDWPRAVRWYVEILGLRLVLEDRDGQFALLDAGAGQLALKGGATSAEPAERFRLVFRVDDLEGERDRLTGLGIAVSPVSENTREGYREIRLSDSEGTPLTLFGWLSSRGSPSAGRLKPSMQPE